MTFETAAWTAVRPRPDWPVFETPLIGRDLVADRTMSFRFAKPREWSYRAGQFVDITLLDPPETDAEGNLRGFSISSAPREDVGYDHHSSARYGVQARSSTHAAGDEGED